MSTESKERDYHVNVVYGYLTSGNSVHDLVTQLVQDELDYYEQVGIANAYSASSIING